MYRVTDLNRAAISLMLGELKISALPCQLITVSHCVTVDNLPLFCWPETKRVLMCAHKGDRPDRHANLMEVYEHRQRNYRHNYDFLSAFRY